MSGKSEPPKPPVLPKPPKKEDMMDIIDMISGTKTVVVKGVDGKKRLETTRLPRTPEEEQFYKQGEAMIGSALTNLKELYEYDPSAVINYSPIIDTFANLNDKRAEDLSKIADLGDIKNDINTFRQIQRNIFDDQMIQAELKQENRLAQSGHYNSTGGNELRAMLAKEKAIGAQQVEANAIIQGEQLAQQRLGLNQQAFNLNEIGRQGELQKAQLEYQLAQQQKSDLDAYKQSQIDRNKGLLQIGSGMTGNDLNKALQGKTAQLGLQQNRLANSTNLSFHQSNVNRLNTDYKNKMAHYNAQPPSIGSSLGKIAITGLSTAIGAAAGPIGASIGSSIGSKISGAMFDKPKAG